MTVQDLINQALMQLNAIASGEAPSVAESEDALVVLNSMIDNWSAQLGPIPTLSRYTVGLFGSSSSALPERPLKIKAASISSGSLIAEIKVVLPDEWSTGGGTASMPFLLCDYGYPTTNIYVRPVLTGTLELLSLKPLARFNGLADPVDLPQGYERALINGLAAEMLTQYPQVAGQLGQHIVDLATDAKVSIQGLNQDNLGAVGPKPQAAAQQ